MKNLIRSIAANIVQNKVVNFILKGMIKNLFAWLLLILLFFSCSFITGDKPVGTLSESKMSEILTDMHIVEAKMRVTTDSAFMVQLRDTSFLRARFSEVFLKHETTPDEFNQSLDYYLEHIEKLDEIYDQVISKLTELETTVLNKDAKTPAGDKQKSKQKSGDTLINESNTAKVKQP